jgi:cell division protein FtsL
MLAPIDDVEKITALKTEEEPEVQPTSKGIAGHQIQHLHLPRISFVQKLFYSAVVMTGLMFAGASIVMNARVMELEQSMLHIQSDISSLETQVEENDQQIRELLSNDRLLAAAEKAGLASHDDNIKKATK